MPFIQLQRTNGRNDDLSALIFDEEREKIIMRENFCYARKTDIQEKKRNDEKKFLFYSKVMLFYQHY